MSDFWGDEFGLPIPNGLVFCATVFKGDLVVGGTFTHIGGKAVWFVARWNGTEWLPMADGMDGPVWALLVDGDVLYAGGSFRLAGHEPTDGIGVWNGTSWAAVGDRSLTQEGHFPRVLALTAFEGDLIVGGSFQSDANTDVAGVARYHGGEWLPVGKGIHGVVSTLAVYRDSLYAGGTFDSAGTVPAANIARYDGSHWADIGGVTGGGPSALAVYRGRLFVGGNFRRAGGQDIWSLASWNGSIWEAPIGSGDLNVTALHVQDDRLLIATNWGVDAWDGESLVVSQPFFSGWCFAMTSFGSELVVAGSFTDGGSPPVFHLGRWDGAHLRDFSTWNSKMNGLVDQFGHGGGVKQLASYQGRLFALGDFKNYGSKSGWRNAEPLLTWDGNAWTSVDFSVTSFEGTPTLILSAADLLYVAGDFQDRNVPSGLHPVLVFDGQSWTSLDPLDALIGAMAVVNGTLYVATTQPDQPDYPRIYRHRDNAWEEIAHLSELGTVCTPTVAALGQYRGDLVVLGHFSTIGGVAANGAAAWDGLGWHALGSGPNGCIAWNGSAETAVLNDRLIVPVTDCACIDWSRGHLESWDGRTWSSIDGMHGSISAVAAVNDRLYAAGSLWVGGEPLHVASWDGLEWAHLGFGLQGDADAIAPHEGGIYFGGHFSQAGWQATLGIAHWSGGHPAPPSPKVWLSSARPNPSRSHSDLSLRLQHPGNVRVVVYDIRGREIRVLWDAEMGAGYHPIRWDGRDRVGRSVAAGLYFISARSPDGVATARSVRLR